MSMFDPTGRRKLISIRGGAPWQNIGGGIVVWAMANASPGALPKLLEESMA